MLFLDVSPILALKPIDFLERTEKLGAVFQKVEKAIGDGLYFNGISLGKVDIAWLVLLQRADIICRYVGYEFLGNYSRVEAWQEALMQTGLAEKSVAKDFEQSFAEFSLSDSTYQGRSENCENILDEACATGTCCNPRTDLTDRAISSTVVRARQAATGEIDLTRTMWLAYLKPRMCGAP